MKIGQSLFLVMSLPDVSAILEICTVGIHLSQDQLKMYTNEKKFCLYS